MGLLVPGMDYSTAPMCLACMHKAIRNGLIALALGGKTFALKTTEEKP